MKQIGHKTVYVDSAAYRKAVSLKLAQTIKKVESNNKFASNKSLARDLGELAYKMGINPDVSGSCKLRQFVSLVSNAHEDHVRALDHVLDKVNKGLKAAKEFSKAKQ